MACGPERTAPTARAGRWRATSGRSIEGRGVQGGKREHFSPTHVTRGLDIILGTQINKSVTGRMVGLEPQVG